MPENKVFSMVGHTFWRRPKRPTAGGLPLSSLS